MDDNKSGLYIVAIVGVIAVVALVVMVMNVNKQKAGNAEDLIYSVTEDGKTTVTDATGQMYNVFVQNSGTVAFNLCKANGGWVHQVGGSVECSYTRTYKLQ